MTASIVEDHSIESRREDPAERTIKFLEKIGFFDLVSNEHEFNDWLQNLSLETAQNYLNRINGLVRGKPIKDRFIDGDNVEIQTQVGGEIGYSYTEYLPPRAEDKQELLEKTFEAIRGDMPNLDRARLSYYALIAIHYFNDGNGRTARLLYHLFDNVGNSEAFDREKLYKFLSHQDDEEVGSEGREEIAKDVRNPDLFYMYPRYLVAFIDLASDFRKEYEEGVYSGIMPSEGYDKFIQHLRPELQEKLLKLREGGKGRYKTFDLALVRFLIDNGLLDQYKEKNEYTDPNSKIYNFEGDKLLRDLNDSQVIEIINHYWAYKYKFVSTIIDMFRNPALEEFKNSACKL